MRLTYLLGDLSCADCGTPDVLWLDPARGLVECHECGRKASIIVDPLDHLDPLDAFGTSDEVGTLHAAGSFGWLDASDVLGGPGSEW